MIIIDNSFTTCNEIMYKTEDFYKKLISAISLKEESDENLIKQISNACNINSYEIIHYLLSDYSDNPRILKEIREYYYSNRVDQHRCIVVADSHIGRLASNETNITPAPLANERMLFEAYNYAYKNGIKNVIHAGDLIEGNSDPGQRRMYICHQLEYLKKVYSQLDNIKTYFLLGNHDYNTKLYGAEKDENLYRIKYNLPPFTSGEVDAAFRSIKNLETIGIKQSYFSLPDSLIKVSHDSSSFYNSANLDSSTNLEITGHSHMYRYDEEKNRLYIPTVSSLERCESCIGFIELVEEEKEIVAKRFNNKAKQSDEKVIKKKFVRY